MAKVVGKEASTEQYSSEQYSKENYQQTEKEIVKFNIQIQAIFKRSPLEYSTTSSHLRRGPLTWIIPSSSLDCNCPKIKINR